MFSLKFFFQFTQPSLIVAFLCPQIVYMLFMLHPSSLFIFMPQIFLNQSTSLKTLRCSTVLEPFSQAGQSSGPASHVLVADSHSSRATRSSSWQGCTKGEIQHPAKAGRELWLTSMPCHQWFQNQDGLRDHHGSSSTVRINILIAWAFCMLAADPRGPAWVTATFSSWAATMASFCSWKHPEE